MGRKLTIPEFSSISTTLFPHLVVIPSHCTWGISVTNNQYWSPVLILQPHIPSKLFLWLHRACCLLLLCPLAAPAALPSAGMPRDIAPTALFLSISSVLFQFASNIPALDWYYGLPSLDNVSKWLNTLRKKSHDHAFWYHYSSDSQKVTLLPI